MRILITGANGLLGQKIVRQLGNRKITFLATSQGVNRNTDCPEDLYQSLDITSEPEIKACIKNFEPTHIIHTAAITNVDQCELDPVLCMKVNSYGVKLLFDLSKEKGIHFQLLSTDFIFDGERGNYKEEDKVGPLSVYANSKVNAENFLLESDYKNWSIVRTIIVYGEGNNLSRSNLVVWAMEALKKNDPMRIVDDQFRAPTWADDLAWACIEICVQKKQGIFHISGPQTMSIFEIVERIADHFGYSKDKIHRLSSSELNQPAKRPPRTGFDITKAVRELGYSPLPLEKTLDLIKNQ